MFTAPGDEASALADKITAVIQHRSANAPRSQQRAIGLSEIGEACVRKISYKLLDWNKNNTNSDPWPSISGTAIHSWLAEAFDDQYDGEENKLYLVEHAVMINDELGGTVDLFDIQAGMVIDHKCVGATSMKSRKKDGMTHQQRIQINCYGLGLERAGYTVNKVALAFYPLGGRLDGMHTIVEPYNRQLAQNAMDRLNETRTLLWQLDPERVPSNWGLIPASTSRMCIYCPFYLPKSTNLSAGCPGEVDAA
jgi:hypothetical protein